MPGVEWRSGIVLDSELNRLSHILPSELGRDGNREVDPS
jgi:hypothetical protein